jgi:hypothetical protein
MGFSHKNTKKQKHKKNKTNKTNKTNKIINNRKNLKKQKKPLNKRSFHGGVIGYDVNGNRLQPSKYTKKEDVMQFWLAYFNNDFEKMKKFKLIILKMTEITRLSSPYLCNYLQEKISVFDVTQYAIDYGYKPTICFVTILCSYLSSLLEYTCTLLVKGGRAVQLALSMKERYDPIFKKIYIPTRLMRKYPSNDMDILILPETGRPQDSQLLALRIGEFIDWLTTLSQQGVTQDFFSLIHLPKVKFPVESNPEIPKEGSIIKLSIRMMDRGYVAVSDIGYITSEHTNIFDTNPIRTVIDDNPENPGYLLSVNPQNIFLEKTYYAVKYNSRQYNNQSELNRFRASLHRSYNFLLDDLTDNIYAALSESEQSQQVKPDIKNKLISYYFDKLQKLIPSVVEFEVSVEELIAFVNGPTPIYLSS